MNREYIIQLIHEYNPSLNGKIFPTPEFKRELYYDIIKWMDKKQAIGIVGLRRIGKTTLMRQLMKNLDGNPTYFSFDEEETQTKETLVFVIDYLLNNHNSEYLFLDEIHYVHDWQGVLKRYYDQKGVKFIISGSESMNLSKAKESLAGRLLTFELQPLKFREFLALRGEKIETRDISLYEFDDMEKLYHSLLTKSGVFQTEFLEYIYKGAFPEIVNENDEMIIRKYIDELVVRKIIYRDIPAIFQIKRRDLLYALVDYASHYSSNLFLIKNLASTFEANAETIRNYIFYLRSAFLIKTSYSYSKSFAKTSRRSKKLYISSPSIAIAILGYSKEMFVEKLLGPFVESVFAGKYFYRDKAKNEVDIVSAEEEIVPIEVKFQNNIFPSDLKNIKLFAHRFGAKKGVLITKDKFDRKSVDKKEILVVPAWLALMVYQ